jgi:transaldolase
MSNQKNPLLEIQKYGQSIWLDTISRKLIVSGQLQDLIDKDGLRGVTSNPSIFEKAIDGSQDYDQEINELLEEGKDVPAVYTELTVRDIQQATDRFRPLFDQSSGKHGFVSLEVSPHLAHETQATIEEARRLWGLVDRPNVMIKVPATQEGLPAIQQLIGEGINVNITLLFGLPRYRKVAEAFIAGLEKRVEEGKPVDHLASVASFFLSRIDVLVDPMLEKIMQAGGPKADLAKKLHGQVAIASAKLAYQIFTKTFSNERFNKLGRQGARPQRVLWASTSTKNPNYSDVKYVEALIGPETVNTIPLETLEAYRDHGDPAPRLEENLDEARQVMESLPDLGIDIDQVTQQLEDEGVEKFNKPYDKLMGTLTRKCEKIRGAA